MRYFENDIFSNSGDPIHVIYSPVVNKDGTIDLVESGKENTDDIIQSFLEECDLNVILTKYINGDESVLNRKLGAFGDFTNMPKTYAEMLQIQIKGKEIFDSLPVETKVKFDNDFNKFFVSIGSEEWYKNMEKHFEKLENKIEEKGEE